MPDPTIATDVLIIWLRPMNNWTFNSRNDRHPMIGLPYKSQHSGAWRAVHSAPSSTSPQTDPIRLSRRSSLMTQGAKPSPHTAHAPVVALALGWSGVLPFAGCTAILLLGHPASTGVVATALISYGSIILGFMGSVHWGLEMSQPRAPLHYVASVVPALLAFAATLSPATQAIALLMCGFAGLIALDMWRCRFGDTPAWYRTLRLQLTAAVMFLLTAALVSLSQA